VILSLITPDRAVASVADLDPVILLGGGIRGIILDLDNTIVPWGEAAPPTFVREWVRRVRAGGLRGCIVSNNSRGWVAQVGEILGLPVVGWALKPLPFGFLRAMALMGTRPRETALIGDQLFTDILGGKLIGVRTILVEPLSVREFATTRLIRRIERLVRAKVLERVRAD
jgi:hypothetical protein